jgi:uncharacterized protein (DUF305 family)
MTPIHPRSIAATLLTGAALLAAPAAAQGQHQHGAASPSDTSRYTAADVHFMSGMISHHAQAIDMARMAPTHGASATLLRLTERIINAQQDEIALMQRWLRVRGQPVPEAVAMPMMHDGRPMLMAGMLSEAQMHELDAARGDEFDRLFLMFMIQHHQGAVSMVRELFGSYGAGQDDTVFKIASDINVDQTTEIDRMKRMLAEVMFGAQPSR